VKRTKNAHLKKNGLQRSGQGKAEGSNFKVQTRLIHGFSKSPRWDYSHHVVPPITSSAAFRLNSSQRGARGFFEFACDRVDTPRHIPIYIYDRLDEPTRGMLEENLALAESGETAVCFATGMAAISAGICMQVRAGDEIVAHELLYGCTFSLLTNWMPRQGVSTRFVNLQDRKALTRALNKKTRVVYFETPVNPTMELIDIAGIREVVDLANRGRSEHNKIRIIVDNTFATPFCQRPLELGSDFVVASLTKGIGGFGTDMGGVLIGSRSFHNVALFYRKDFGGVLSPKAAWNILVYGLPSLAARMQVMQQSAFKVAEFLAGHPRVKQVLYPGLSSFAQRDLAERQMRDYRGGFAPGSMLYFTLREAGKKGERAQRFIDQIADHAYCVTLAVSLGQVKTLIENPYSMTHSAYHAGPKSAVGSCVALEPGGIRLSIGLEDPEDIISDLEQALRR